MRFITRQFSLVTRLITTITICAITAMAFGPLTAQAAMDELITTTARCRTEAVKDVEAFSANFKGSVAENHTYTHPGTQSRFGLEATYQF
ncbi:MAG: hypothetical protein QGH93_06210 [Gammaproteobacteria bacterium]|jgi:hypothetical protein|nr:hypothetical protein [Chromatiales bacterium]MDP6674428.1 hypothetical protein [Gammaproteobacteria bacterium]